MRKFTGGNGADTTSTVVAFLKSAAANQLIAADLILIGEQEDPRALYLTNWESPLAWPVWGTFLPASIKRAKVTSQVGLEVTSMNLEWSTPIGLFTNDVATTSPYQLAQHGFYDNKRVRVWRTVMPTPGDANTYGACEWFGGWIANTTVARGKITFKVDSFLNVINQKVPINVIESQNTLSGFVGATPVLVDGETSVPTFQVVSPSSSLIVLGLCIQPTSGKIYGGNKFQRGFMVFLRGSTLAGFWSAIATNGNFNAGGGVHYNQFQVYDPFPWPPTPGDQFYVSTAFPVNQADGQYQGFPFVPDPETAT